MLVASHWNCVSVYIERNSIFNFLFTFSLTSSIWQINVTLQLTVRYGFRCVYWLKLAWCHFDCHRLITGGRIGVHLTTEYQLILWNAEEIFEVAVMMRTAPRCLTKMSVIQWILMESCQFLSDNNFHWNWDKVGFIIEFSLSFYVKTEWKENHYI